MSGGRRPKVSSTPRPALGVSSLLTGSARFLDRGKKEVHDGVRGSRVGPLGRPPQQHKGQTLPTCVLPPASGANFRVYVTASFQFVVQRLGFQLERGVLYPEALDQRPSQIHENVMLAPSLVGLHVGT